MEEKENKVVEVEKKEKVLYDNYTSVRSKIIASIGIIITVIAIGLVFFISSLEGTREVKAGNYKSGKILNVWREAEGITDEEVYPSPKITIIAYGGKDYYYMEEYDEVTGEVSDWYFAFEGGLRYVFSDYKYYVLTAIVGVIAIFVSYINYVSSKNSSKEADRFIGALKYYKDAKDKVRGNFHLIPLFCIDKNRETRDTVVRDIVEETGVFYEEYVKPDYDKTGLEKWQLKILKKIRKIKLIRLKSPDLLQEKPIAKGATIRLLPAGEKETEKAFLIKSSFQKIITIAMSGAVVAFGVVLGNWALGATYGVTVAMGGVTASIAGADYVFNTLRNRYIAKADYLIEFDGVKEKYIVKEVVKIETKVGEPNGDKNI